MMNDVLLKVGYRNIINRFELCIISLRNVVITGYFVDWKTMRADTLRVLFKHIGS